MPALPASTDFNSLPVLMLGGDGAAVAAIRALYASLASIRVVAPDPAAEIIDWAIGEALILKRRDFRDSDLDNIRLVVTSGTADAVLTDAARDRNIPIHMLDDRQ